MKSIALLSLAAAALTFTSCSSTPTHVDKGTIHAQTFSFVNRGNRPAPNFAEGSVQALAMVQDAITKNLAAKGVTKVDSGGDITVGFLVIIGNNAQTEAIDTYFGDAEAADALHEKAQDAYTSNKDPNHFEAGTLVIDIIDGKNYKLLVRNYASRQMLNNITVEARAERIQDVVDQILKDVRIEH
jgi:Domain of unknown function (DUF4136)